MSTIRYQPNIGPYIGGGNLVKAAKVLSHLYNNSQKYKQVAIQAKQQYDKYFSSSKKRPAKEDMRNTKKAKTSGRKAAPGAKSTVKSGSFRKTQFKRVKRSRRSMRRRGRFARKVTNVINKDCPKGHYLVRIPMQIDGGVGNCGFNQIAVGTTQHIIEGVEQLTCARNINGGRTDTELYDRTKIHVTGRTLDIFLKNQSNCCVYVDEYIVVPKVHSGSMRSLPAESTNPFSWLANYGKTSNVRDLPLGDVPFSTLNPSPGVYKAGMTLFHYSQFFQNFKILKKTRMLLQPGECFTKQKRNNKTHIINMDKLNVPDTTDVNLTSYNPNNKTTVYYFYIAWGEPTANSEDSQQVNSAAYNLDCYATIDYKFRIIPRPPVKNPNATYLKDQLPAFNLGRSVQTTNSTVNNFIKA